MEAHGTGLSRAYDRVKQALRLETDRPTVLRQAILACRKGGTVSVPGVYGGFVDKIPIGAVVEKGSRMRTGQTHVHRYLRPLLDASCAERIDPTVDHQPPPAARGRGARVPDTANHEDGCVKVVLKTQAGEPVRPPRGRDNLTGRQWW